MIYILGTKVQQKNEIRKKKRKKNHAARGTDPYQQEPQGREKGRETTGGIAFGKWIAKTIPLR